MIKVWIATQGYDYNISEVLGVSLTKEGAMAHCRTDWDKHYGESQALSFNHEDKAKPLGHRGMYYGVKEYEASE